MVKAINDPLSEKISVRNRKAAPSAVVRDGRLRQCTTDEGSGRAQRNERADKHHRRQLFRRMAAGTNRGVTRTRQIEAKRKRYGGSQSITSQAARFQKPFKGRRKQGVSGVQLDIPAFAFTNNKKCPGGFRLFCV